MVTPQQVKSLRMKKRRKNKFISLTLLQNLDTMWYKEALLEMTAIDALLSLSIVRTLSSTSSTSSS